MNRRDPLDEALGSLPQSVPPPPELWRSIEAQLAPAARPFGRSSAWLQLAAAVLLVVGTATTTFLLTRQSQTPAPVAAAPQPAPALNAMPASFATEQLGAGYREARAALDAEFERRIAKLPPAARAKVLSDLAELRRAANEIAATLARHPSDPLLQDLMMSTYQSELALFDSVSDAARRTQRVDL